MVDGFRKQSLERDQTDAAKQLLMTSSKPHSWRQREHKQVQKGLNYTCTVHLRLNRSLIIEPYSVTASLHCRSCGVLLTYTVDC